MDNENPDENNANIVTYIDEFIDELYHMGENYVTINGLPFVIITKIIYIYVI